MAYVVYNNKNSDHSAMELGAMMGKGKMEGNNFKELPYEISAEDFIDTKKILPETKISSRLTADEESGLTLMREEEKLARDVYTVLGEKWGVKIFSNIAASEATHMQAVRDLLVRYVYPTIAI